MRGRPEVPRSHVRDDDSIEECTGHPFIEGRLVRLLRRSVRVERRGGGAWEEGNVERASAKARGGEWRREGAGISISETLH